MLLEVLAINGIRRRFTICGFLSTYLSFMPVLWPASNSAKFQSTPEHGMLLCTHHPEDG